MNIITLSSSFPAWAIPVILVGVFGVIVLAVILIKKKFKIFQDDSAPKSDKEIAHEEVNRILEDVEDEETKKQMEEFASKDESKK